MKKKCWVFCRHFEDLILQNGFIDIMKRFLVICRCKSIFCAVSKLCYVEIGFGVFSYCSDLFIVTLNCITVMQSTFSYRPEEAVFLSWWKLVCFINFFLISRPLKGHFLLIYGFKKIKKSSFAQLCRLYKWKCLWSLEHKFTSYSFMSWVGSLFEWTLYAQQWHLCAAQRPT